MNRNQEAARPTQPRLVDVAVVVVTYNSATRLAALGRTLTAGTVLPARMIVVDNSSADDTVASAASAGFEVVETGANNGFGAGCNVGLASVQNEFILFCNPDVTPEPDAIGMLLAALAGDGRTAIAGARFDDKLPGRRHIRLSGQLVGFLPKRLSRRHPFNRYECRVAVDDEQDQVPVDFAVGAFILCRADALRSIGGFDERFFLYFEEDDLARRLADSGWRTVLVPAARVAHEHNASSEGLDGPTMAAFRIHSAYAYYRKWHSRPYAELARCMLFVGVTLDRVYRAFARRPQVYGSGSALAPFRSTASVRAAASAKRDP